jgi:hypothetical protein
MRLIITADIGTFYFGKLLANLEKKHRILVLTQSISTY